MKWLDPAHLFGEEGYRALVNQIFLFFFNDTFARVLSAALLLMGAWLIFRRKQIAAGIGMILLSVAIIFGKTVVMYMGRIW